VCKIDTRLMRVRLAEKALGIPYFERCPECHTPLGHRRGKDQRKTGLCRQCASKLLPKPPKSAPCREKAIRLYQAGYSGIKIAKTCALTPERVYQFLRPLGLTAGRGMKANPEIAKRRLQKKLAVARKTVLRRARWACIQKLYLAGVTHRRLCAMGFTECQYAMEKMGTPKRKIGEYDRTKKGRWKHE